MTPLENTQDPDPIHVSDWLLNLRDKSLELAATEYMRATSSSSVLSYWVLINTTITTEHILHTWPNSIDFLGKLFLECRIYYENVLHIVLDRRSKSEIDKKMVEKCVADVRLELSSIISLVFSENPRLKLLLQEAIGEHYDDSINGGLLWYHAGLYPLPDEMEDDDELVQATMTLSMRIAGMFEENNVELSWDKLIEFLVLDTGNALKMVFMANFNMNLYFRINN